jgi:valyl-tRNA synthetase
MKHNLAPKYDHIAVEKDAYQRWVQAGYFKAQDSSKPPFTLVIPPPNVTGRLHLGHAWDTALQDIIARFKRMQGFDTLWLPGMDHAGIATQAKIDARLKEEGLQPRSMERAEWMTKAWQWKEEYAQLIRDQWAKLGLSLDYSRERFTLDEGLSKAVNRVFIDLYEKGLIYRGTKPINWDPIAQTALSNIEVIYKREVGKMYYLKYYFEDSEEYLEIATTRLETLASDTAVVVHPKDARFTHLVGRKVITPLRQEAVPIITDEFIDMDFGTGIMKCSAHGNGDFEILMKHQLEVRESINPDGTLNANAMEFEGLERFEGRERIAEKLMREGLITRVEEHHHEVGHSERSDAVIEIMVMPQWFVKMEPLAEAVMALQQNSNTKVEFYPPRFEQILTHWMSSVQDWCISRQIWWGHRIPAWYREDEVRVQENSPGAEWTQDEDVLDTWFSSALWPFSTLGWPEKTDDLARHYPSNVLVTGYDIIFFWVSRMIFQALEFTAQKPFHHVLIHGLIRDAEGRKMSKSLGNGVDPMDVIDQYGADALRFFLTTNSSPGLDLRYAPQKVEAAWNFINKLWNAARFVLMSLPEDFEPQALESLTLNDIDHWMLSRYDESVVQITNAMEAYEFALAGARLYDFVWDEYCSWYIELAKTQIHGSDQTAANATLNTLVFVLKGILKLTHPTLPFVSEAIYTNLSAQALCVSPWPTPLKMHQAQRVKEVEGMLALISEIRALRSEYKLKPSQPLKLKLDSSLSAQTLAAVSQMVKVSWVDTLEGDRVQRVFMGGTFSLGQAQLIDVDNEILRLKQELKRLDEEVLRSEGLLRNERFMAQAPAAKIEAEQAKYAEYQRQSELLKAQLAKLT